ncbi:hypothetical protein W02_00990 [Nitrospira sp. KM1]|nr:hypothetical protein W02_00990 [Nitrospira sp. KM1]
MLGIVCLLVLALLLTVVAYLQTPHAFRHVLVPLVQRITGAAIDARSGALYLRGQLEMGGFAFVDADSGLALTAERVHLRLSPWTLIKEPLPVIEELQIQGAEVRMRLDQRSGKESGDVQKSEPVTSRPFHFPVVIERARLDDSTVIIETNSRRLSGRIVSALEHIGPGRTGSISVRAGLLIEQENSQDLSGTIDLGMSVDVTSDGSFRWEGTNKAFVRKGPGGLEPTGTDVFGIRQALAGHYQGSISRLNGSSELALTRGKIPLGTASLAWNVDGSARATIADGSLTLSEVTPDALNLWLAEHEGLQLQADSIGAEFIGRLEGAKTSVRGQAKGIAVRLLSTDGKTGPPVDVVFQEDGWFDSATDDLGIQLLSLTISEGARIVATGELDRPTVLNLAPRDHEVTMEGQEDRSVWSVKLISSRIQDLRPWATLFGPDPFKGVTAGTVQGAMSISMREHGMTMDASGQLRSTGVLVQSEAKGGVIGPLEMLADVKAKLTGLSVVDLQSIRVTTHLNNQTVAVLQATGGWQLSAETGLSGLDGSLDLTGLPGEALNPLVGLWSRVKVGRARIDGHAALKMNRVRASWEVRLQNKGLHLLLPDSDGNVPPLDLTVSHSGEFVRDERTVRLNQLLINVFEEKRSVAALSLDHPLTMHLLATKAGHANGPTDPITLGLRINRLSIGYLRPWIELGGGQPIRWLRTGVIDADLKARFIDVDDIALAGRLDLDRISFANVDHAVPPMVFSTDIRGSIARRSKVTVESWTARVRGENQVLGHTRLSGTADSGGSSDVVLEIASQNMAELLERLGLLTERQYGLISGGHLAGNVRVVTAGPGRPFTAQGTLRGTDLSIRMGGDQRMTRSLNVTADVEVDPGRHVAEIKRGEIDVHAGERDAGRFSISGRWPVNAEEDNAQTGSIEVAVQEWDGGAVADFFNLLPGRASGPLLVTGAVKISRTTGGKSLTVQGSETIGPITVEVASGKRTSATMMIKHNVGFHGDEIRVSDLSLDAKRLDGLPDKATMSGSIRKGANRGAHLRGHVESLDVDWYTGLLTEREDRGHPRTAERSKRTHEDPDMTDALDVDIDLAVGTILYRNLEIGSGRLAVKSDDTGLHAMLDPTGIAGGSVQGTVTLVEKHGLQDIGWDVKGNALDLGVLIKAILSEQEPRIIGRGRFTTIGHGQGQGERLRKSLTGTATVDVEDGKFVHSPALEFLAEKTNISDFKGLGFRTIHGEFRAENGWIYLDQLKADGPSVAVQAAGKIGLDGRVDAFLEPQVGPQFSEHVKIPCLDQFTKTAEGFTRLPVAVSVKGTLAKPSFGADVTSANLVARQTSAVIGTVADVLTGCRGGQAAQKATENAFKAATDSGKQLFDKMLGGKKEP